MLLLDFYIFIHEHAKQILITNKFLIILIIALSLEFSGVVYDVRVFWPVHAVFNISSNLLKRLVIEILGSG